MKAIVTKYHGATNTRGSRVSATAEGGNRISLPWDDALNSEENHRKAALALTAKMKWSFLPLISGGGLPNLDTVHMFSPELKEALRVIIRLHNRLEAVLRKEGATDLQIQTHPDLCAAHSVTNANHHWNQQVT